LVFDYSKGDIADNADFAQAVNAQVVRLPDQRIPLSPLALPQYDEHSVKIAVRRLRDTINSVVRLGPKQSDRCLRIVREVYSEKGRPELEDVAAAAEEIYVNEEPDSLLACFREFAEFRLFTGSENRGDVELLTRSHIIDLSRLPDSMRKLAVFLTLDRVYTDVMGKADAPLDKEGNRQVRLIVVIDEAHNYLPCRQATLEKLVREGGSKGVVIMLMSQSPDDFDQRRYNFAREMGLALVFSCVVERPKMLEALLGGRIDPHRLSQLGQGIALTRLQGSSRPSEVKAW
jgi:hypothetical protein